MFQLPAAVEYPVVDHRNDTTLRNVVNHARAFVLLSYRMITKTVIKEETERDRKEKENRKKFN